MTPFSIQVVRRTGSPPESPPPPPPRPPPAQGLPGLRRSNGSERRFTPSANSFSPRRVPPPGLDRKLRPSSAERALSAKASPPRRAATASGSRITVYLPGGRSLGRADDSAFLAARS